MSVENTIVKNVYQGNGTTTQFPITFQVSEGHPEYVLVYITDADSKTQQTDNFTVDLETKNVTYPKTGNPLPTGQKITVYRKLPLYQLLNLKNNAPFFAENIEESLDDITFIVQQLNENLSRVLAASVEVMGFDTTFPVKAGMGIRINDAGTGIELTEDPARVLPLARDVLAQTEKVKADAVEETTNIKDAAVTATTDIKNAAVTETTEIKDTAIAETTEIKNAAVTAANTAVTAAETAAADAAAQAVANVTADLDAKVTAAANSQQEAATSASSAAASLEAATKAQEAAAASAKTASTGATTATEQADRAQGIAEGLSGLAGITGVATQAEAEAGTADDKAMTPLNTKQAITKQMTPLLAEKADLIDNKVPAEQLPAMDYVPNADVGNAANKIPKYNADGHLVLPNGAEFWIG